jgi:hypothetical protein
MQFCSASVTSANDSNTKNTAVVIVADDALTTMLFNE